MKKIGIIIIFIFLIIVGKTFYNSLFFTQKDRINIVVLEEGVRFYSLDRKGGTNYFLFLPADIRVIVPGGYGFYRVGGLPKLVFLEKKPLILKRTFSLVTSTFVDFYFYPASGQIFYGFTVKENVSFPSLKQLFFYQSEANLFDRLYLLWFFVNTPARKFIELPIFYDKKTKNFLIDEFFENNQGALYQQKLREEEKNLQIVFSHSYQTAMGISRLLEGEGIRVNDITQEKNPSSFCLVIEDDKKHSFTAKRIANFFQCQLKEGETAPYDIIFYLGNLEKEWEVDNFL